MVNIKSRKLRKPSQNKTRRLLKGGYPQKPIVENEFYNITDYYSLEKILTFYNEYEKADIPTFITEVKTKIGELEKGHQNYNGLDSAGTPLLWDVKRISEEPAILKNSVLTFIQSHGEVKGGYNMTPPNTIICFLSPIGDLNNIIVEDVRKKFSKINLEELKNLLTLRINYRKAPLNFNMGRFNCFANSAWYYPGDMYPDINCSYLDTEYKGDRKTLFQISQNKSGTKTIKTDMFETFHGRKRIPKSEFTSNSFYNFTLHEKLSNFSTISNGFRLIILDCCRSFSSSINADTRTSYLKVELLYLQHNILQDKNSDKNFKFSCDLCFSLSHNEYIIQYLKELKLLRNLSEKKYCLNGRTSTLVKIAYNYNGTEPTLESNAKYIASLSPNKIVTFFNNNLFTEDKNLYLTDFLEKVKDTFFFTKIHSMIRYLRTKLYEIEQKNYMNIKTLLTSLEEFKKLIVNDTIGISIKIQENIEEILDIYQKDPVIKFLQGPPSEVDYVKNNIFVNQESEYKEGYYLCHHLIFKYNLDVETKAIANFKNHNFLETLSLSNLTLDKLEISNHNLSELYITSDNPLLKLDIQSCTNLEKIVLNKIDSVPILNLSNLKNIKITRSTFDIRIIKPCQKNITSLEIIDCQVNLTILFKIIPKLTNLFLIRLKGIDTKQIDLPKNFLSKKSKLNNLSFTDIPNLKIKISDLLNPILNPTNIIIYLKNINLTTDTKTPKFKTTAHTEKYQEIMREYHGVSEI